MKAISRQENKVAFILAAITLCFLSNHICLDEIPQSIMNFVLDDCIHLKSEMEIFYIECEIISHTLHSCICEKEVILCV